MRALYSIITITVFTTGSLFAGTKYVKSARAKVYKSQNTSAVVATARSGQRVNVVSTTGAWSKVQYRGKTGFMKKYYLTARKPAGKLSILSSAKSNAMVHARKRASSDVTAASARGLMSLGSAGANSARHARRRASSDVTAASARGLMSLGSADAKASQHARERASSDVTAASARGLRQNQVTEDYIKAKPVYIDPNALEQMESQPISQDDVIAFLEEGGL